MLCTVYYPALVF